MSYNVLKNLICNILLLLSPIFLFGQSPYQLDRTKEIFLFGTGAATLAGGMYLHYKAIDPLTEAEIYNMSKLDILSFDRFAASNYSIKASEASDVFLIGSHFLPALFIANQKSRNDLGKIMLLYGETLLLTEGITNLTKRLTKRPRPYVFNEEVSISKKQTIQARYAFFSGHTSVTTSNFFFTAKVFSDFFPDSKLKPYVWGVSALAPALTGYLRVRAGKHYPTDVITGYAVGAFIGFMVPQLHKTREVKNLSFYPSLSGMRIALQF